MSNWSEATSPRVTHMAIVTELRAARRIRDEAEAAVVEANQATIRAFRAHEVAFARVLELERALDAFVAEGVF